ncbi:MarR family winged helix-turn-helix transcriptional regulator [Streptomyces sp. NPDC059850]|uniref:MarR family winged helix-turn-helix transcriptional regulator n=1 Tax=Streptomyces sp. NPDC059850 TaxID=3346970 RepID=UPI00365E81D6
MLVARCHVLTPRDRKASADAPAEAPSPDRLDRSAYLLLSRLDAEGAMSIGQLADAFQLDVSTVNRQTGTLLRGGLAERIPDPDGGLARKLRVTTLGAERLTAERDCRRTSLSRLLEDWTEEDLSRFGEALTRFNREVEAHDGRPWPRAEESESPPEGTR